MKYITWKFYMIGAFLINLFIAFVMWSYLDPRCHCTDFERRLGPSHLVQEVLQNHKGENISLNVSEADISSNFLIVMRDFEFFENDISETVKSILQFFPPVKILILTDKSPYPPLLFPDDVSQFNVHIINLNPMLKKAVTDRCVHSFIDKEHILFVPDSVRFESKSQILDMFKLHFERPHDIIAAPVGNDNVFQCLYLNVSVRHWTIKYRENPKGHSCDALLGTYLLLITKTLLLHFDFPFARPFPHSLFIQSALLNVKVEILRNSFFQSGKPLFTDIHNRWKHDSFENSRKEELYKDLGIKKVILPASKVEWYGCNKNTARCFGTVVNDMPEYLVEGRWAPPCCLENLRRTARYVFGILEKCGVRYWLEGGSLLGAARNGDIISWDYDVDIGIYRDDILKCEWLKNSLTQSIIDSQGFVWEKAREGNFIRVQYSQSNHLHVDIFPFYSKNGTMTKDSWFPTHEQDREFPEHFLKPLSKIKFVGIQASAPNNYREFLELKFGKGAIETPKYPVPEALLYFKKHL